jgi:hypothetical protein
MREIGTGDKSASSGRTHSRDSARKHKEESSSSIKSQQKGDMKKKMKKVVYYETDSSSPSISGSESASATSKRYERKEYSKMPHRRLQARQQGNSAHHQELSPNPQAKEGEGLQASLQESLLQVW